ncbi:hypothetical protein [Bradyrhizobium sp. SZCCHNRI1002]|uniref:hypothetical protein n=1 Tax=Bradyrhizobium sp. SZCCHNRI1002 TaxID=3057274 RepID=UPI0028E72D40|nr:hypothetical protein [Bradyrhizobium sp. SZCCHNRI1002]
MPDETTPPNSAPEKAAPAAAAGVSVNEIYKEQYAHFRAMNDLLYKIPPLFTAVIGALWYFAVQNMDKTAISGAVFLFAAVASVCFVIVMERFRAAFVGYIDNLNKMDGAMKVTIRPSCLPSTIKTVQFLLLLASLLSFGGLAYVLHLAGLSISFK